MWVNTRRGTCLSRGLIAAGLAARLLRVDAVAATEPPVAAPASDTGDGPIVRGSIIPLSFADGRYTALVQLFVGGSPLAEAHWELRLALSTDGKIVHEDSATASSSVARLPVVFEREIGVAPGRHMLALEARETNRGVPGVDARSVVRIDVDWPDPAVTPVIVGPLGVMQPAEALFVRQDSSRRLGPVDHGAQPVVQAARSTVMLSLACRGAIEGRMYVRGSLARQSSNGTWRTYAFSKDLRSLEPEPQDGLCVQIRDRVPADRLSLGTSRYEVRLTLLPDGPAVAERAVEVTAREGTGEGPDRQLQVTRLVELGSAALARGELEQAAAAFDQAFAIEHHHGLRTLRDQAAERLELRACAERAERERERSIADGLSRARAFAESGQLGAAIAETQGVLELDPTNADAGALRDGLVREQARSRVEQERQAEIAALRDEIATLVARADHAGALAAANRVLSLDAGNTAAARQVAESHRALADGSAERDNLPPIIEFFRLRDLPLVPYRRDGAAPPSGETELASVPVFVLGGSVIDESEVTLRFLAGDAELGEPTVHRRVVQGLHITEFVVRHRLGPALSFRRWIPCTLTAIATDAEGAVARRDHTVVYRVPVHRSLWVYAIAAGTLLLGGVAAQGLRVQRRRQKLRRRFNPYIVGAPVLRQELFFGRERLVQRVLQAIPNNSVLLYGERRIGKTSLQHRLYRRLKSLEDPDYSFVPVFIDLQGTPQEWFFRTMMREIVEELGSRLDGFSAHPALGADAGYGYGEFVRDMRGILRVLARATDKQVKLVLQIDEIDELNGYDPRVNQLLRSLFTRSFAENVVAVVSGVAIRKDWASHGSPWYNFFEEIEVRPFEREDAEELVRRPIAGIFRLERGVVERVVELSACKPYRIQRMCTELVSRAHEGRRGRITVRDVEAVRDLGEG